MSSQTDNSVCMASGNDQETGNTDNGSDRQKTGSNHGEGTETAAPLKLYGRTKKMGGEEQKARTLGNYYQAVLRTVLKHYKIGQKDPRTAVVDPKHYVYIRPNKYPTRWFQFMLYSQVTEDDKKEIEDEWKRDEEWGKVQMQRMFSKKVRDCLEMEIADRSDAMDKGYRKWAKDKALKKATGNWTRKHEHWKVTQPPTAETVKKGFIAKPWKLQKEKTAANKAARRARTADNQPAADTQPAAAPPNPDQVNIDDEMEIDGDPLSLRQIDPYPIFSPDLMKYFVREHHALHVDKKWKTAERQLWIDDVNAAPNLNTAHPPEVTYNAAEFNPIEPAADKGGDDDEEDEQISSDPAGGSTSATSAGGTSSQLSRHLSSENVKLKQDLLHCQNGLVDAEKRNIDTNKEKENLSNETAKLKRDLCDIQTRLTASAKQLAEWQRYHRTISEVAKFGDGIGKEDQDPTNSQGLQQQNPSRPEMSSTVWKRQSQEPGSDGDSIKRWRFDTQKNLEESGAKKASNVASRSFENML